MRKVQRTIDEFKGIWRLFDAFEFLIKMYCSQTHVEVLATFQFSQVIWPWYIKMSWLPITCWILCHVCTSSIWSFDIIIIAAAETAHDSLSQVALFSQEKFNASVAIKNPKQRKEFKHYYKGNANRTEKTIQKDSSDNPKWSLGKCKRHNILDVQNTGFGWD